MGTGYLKPSLGRIDGARRGLPGALRVRYDPTRRLAAAVIVRAVQDYVIWHSTAAQTYRAAVIAKDPDVIRAYKKKHGERIGAMAGVDPAAWLCSETEFHAILDIDPSKIRNVLKDPENLIAILTGAKEAAKIESQKSK